jgi:hypothetical protein
LAQAVTAGGAAYGIGDLVMEVPETTAIRWVLLGGVAATAAPVWCPTRQHRWMPSPSKAAVTPSA